MGVAYLNKKNDEKIEVSYSSELLKQILWYKVPKCVLKTKHRLSLLLREISFTLFFLRIRQMHNSQSTIKLYYFCYFI